MQPNPIAGLHHVTAIAGDPERNLRFYTDVLGLRFLKRTVNHDDTGTYHFYYGDGRGTPGTTVTFFPWTARGRSGEFGAGGASDVTMLTDPDGLEFWSARLDEHPIEYERDERFGDSLVRFDDPDGIGLEIVASADARDAPVTPWEGSPVPAERQLRGFHSVTLAVTDRDPTEAVLERMGYEPAGREASRYRYRTPAGRAGAIVDLLETDRPRGRMGVGTVHHVAFVAEDEAEERTWRETLSEFGLGVTDVVDRAYFKSIYFREPGGVLFEIATRKPGFTTDEPVEELRTGLALPEWLEADRERIEARLPDVDFEGSVETA